jgi:SAM-dependent methyltransferase
MASFTCKICYNDLGNKFHSVKEMMLGLREQFDYMECAKCGALSLVDIPKELSIYYPQNMYYSFNNIKHNFLVAFLKSQLLNQLLKYYLGHFNLIGKILCRNYNLNRKYSWVNNLKDIPFTSKILDIGSGNGKYLLELFQLGYKDITGIDPYNPTNIKINNSITIYNCEVENLNDKYDFILMNHSLEHIIDQDQIFKEFDKLLNPGGKVLIRIPFIGYAWEFYGVNWYQIDAPRHTTIHSTKSFKILCNKHNLEIQYISHDSNDYQFKFSEQYTKDLTLFEDGNFSNPTYKIWRKKAKQLNSANMGDQVSIMISKASK